MNQIEELHNLGQRSLNLGNSKEALNYYKKILYLDPKDTKAQLKIGNILGKHGKYNDAIKCYDSVLEANCFDTLALINKGLALHYLEKYDDAIKCYKIILEKKPNSAISLYNLSSSLIKQNKINEGLEFLKKAVRIDISYKVKASRDIDFQSIKTRNEFKKIIL